MPRTLRLLFIFALFGLGALLLTAQEGEDSAPAESAGTEEDEAPEVFEGRTGTFEFVAADPESLRAAGQIAREVLDTCDELLTPPIERIPVIAVKLVPDGRGNLEGQTHRLFQDIAGDYGLAVAWNEDLSISLFTQLLTESYLKQLVYTLSDRQRAETVPPWLIAGAALRAQVGLRPALVEYLKELGREAPMIPLEELFGKTRMSELTATDRIAAFWFLDLVSRQFDGSKRLRNFFDTVAAGRPAIETLEQQSEEVRSFPNGVEGWWVVGFQDLVHRETGIVQSLDRSAKLLLILNRFELVDRGRPVSTTATDLWDLRKNAAIQQAVSRRLGEIDLVLPRINPIYYNAFGSLGLVMKALLEGDEETYRQRSRDFEEELAVANRMANEVRTLSNNPSADLPSPSQPATRP